MEELERVLRLHAALFPRMQVQDVVKLLFQSEYGPGHLITDSRQSLQRLQEEYDQMNCREKNTVPLGNGLVRVPLGALLPAQLEDLNRALVLSAACVRGSMLQFQQRAQAAVQLLKQGEWPIEAQTLERFLKTFDPRCQLISHSEIYRQTYHPAYRVILSELVPTIRTE